MKKTTKILILTLVLGLLLLPGIKVLAQEAIEPAPVEQIDVRIDYDQPIHLGATENIRGEVVSPEKPELIMVPDPTIEVDKESIIAPPSIAPVPIGGEEVEVATHSTVVSQDVILDENITAQDLGINEQKLLPTSPYYPIKTIWRGFRSILTFNPVKKVELNLRYANEKLIEAKQVAEEKDNQEIVVKALERYKKDLANVSKIVEKSSEQIKTKAQDFVEKMIDQSFKQQKLIDGIEKRLTPEQFEKVNIVREDGLDYFSQTITNLVAPEQIRERITNVIEKQQGSDFKDFKNIEILKIIEEKVPEQAKQAIQQARENTVQRLQKKMENMVEVKRENFKEYIENIGGNEIRHLEILHDFTQEQVPEFIHKEMERAKKISMERIENKMQEFTREEQKKEFLRHLEHGKMEDIRIIKELENNLAPETIEKVLEIKNEALDNFRQEFEEIEGPQEQQEFLRKMEKLHDVKQLEIFKEIEQVIPLDKKEFFEEMKDKAIEEMEKEINQATNERDRVMILDRLAGDMPEHMEIIKEFAPSVEIMNEIIVRQTDNIRERILNIDDVGKIQHLKNRIDDDSFVRQELEKRAPSIFQQIDSRIENKFEKISKERVMEKLEKAKHEIAQAEKDFREFLTKEEIGEYIKKSPASQHLEQARKHFDEAKQAFEQEKYGHAFGQATAAFHQLNSVWRFVKEIELKHEIAHKRIEKMEQTMEDMVGDFLELEVMELETDEMPIDDKKSLDRAIQRVKGGNLEQAWEQYKEKFEERPSEDMGELKEIDLPFEQMNLSNEQIQKIKQATRILPREIRQKLQNLPPEMIIDAAEQIKSKIQQVPETTTEKVKERIEIRIEQGTETLPSSRQGPETKVGMPNPASEFCIKKGGKLKIKTNADGGQFGICHLPDGTECEEWAFFKGECRPGEQTTIEYPIEGEAMPPTQGEEQRCRHVCKNIGTRSEGWYDSCTGKLIEYAKCADRTTSGSEYGVPGESTTETKPSNRDEARLESPTEVEQIRPWIEPTEPISLPGRTESEPCIQVITYAVSGGICRAFPNPCVVPSGWRKVDKCPEKPSEEEARRPIQIIPEPDAGLREKIMINEPINIQHERIGIEERKQLEGMASPEGSLGKPSLLEKMKNLFR